MGDTNEWSGVLPTGEEPVGGVTGGASGDASHVGGEGPTAMGQFQA